MKGYLLIWLVYWFISGNAFGQCSKVQSQSQQLSFTDVPNWIMNNIRFPTETTECSMATVEKVDISTTWDGRVFITKRLSTIHPTFEKEIIRVVGNIPRCQLSDTPHKSPYRSVRIDFANLIPDTMRKDIKVVSRYLPPLPSTRVYLSDSLSGRDAFIEWVHSKLKIARHSNLRNYSDTLTVQYTVTSCGRIDAVVISNCNSDVIKAELERVMLSSPTWAPARIDGTRQVDMTLCDKIIIDIDRNGHKKPYKAFIDNIYCNSTTKPDDREMTVPNPEIAPIYKGRDIVKSIKDVLPDPEQSIVFSVGFTVEKDGHVSDMNIVASDTLTAAIVTTIVGNSLWTPALQGGVEVRAAHYIYGRKGSSSKITRKNDITNTYDIYGKYYISLVSNPSYTRFTYKYSDDSWISYPFDASGRFSNKAYERALINYYRNGRNKQGTDFRKQYFNRVTGSYIK